MHDPLVRGHWREFKREKKNRIDSPETAKSSSFFRREVQLEQQRQDQQQKEQSKNSSTRAMNIDIGHSQHRYWQADLI